ncbi:hypothetical protein F4V54_00390 [Corynebacterium tuscaniense]|uniref:hypothetical protein n=1 Tax=Corynebacterium tuscaniense TaxID=302449 RepID=UPI001239D190|nr:hypothetical protein [Corynebacterium tuscaniense]KAA8746745.1 hypothetical protein F4V54_00390 [Corynebacterium tuscaniense]
MEGLQLGRWAAGTIFISGVFGAVAGAVWGILRPSYVLVDEGGHPAVDVLASPDNVEFGSFAGFVVLTGVLGIIIGALPGVKTAWRMLFVAAVSLFGAWTFLVVGTVMAAEGVPILQPGVGWFVAPLCAALSYWIGMVASLGRNPI